jgi:hypothetical protein
MEMKDTGWCSNGIPRIAYRTALVALFNKKNRYPDGGRYGQ